MPHCRYDEEDESCAYAMLKAYTPWRYHARPDGEVEPYIIPPGMSAVQWLRELRAANQIPAAALHAMQHKANLTAALERDAEDAARQAEAHLGTDESSGDTGLEAAIAHDMLEMYELALDLIALQEPQRRQRHPAAEHITAGIGEHKPRRTFATPAVLAPG